MLPALAREAAIMAFVDPQRAAKVSHIGRCLIEASNELTLPRDAESVLAVFDLLNLVNCVGGDFQGKRYLVSLIPELVRVPTWTKAQRIRVGCAAWVHRDLDAYRAIVGPDRKPWERHVDRIPEEILPYLIEAASEDDEPTGWSHFLWRCDQLRSMGYVDAETILWLARLAYRGRLPAADVSAAMHKRFPELLESELVMDNQDRDQVSDPHESGKEPKFTELIGGGTFCIDEHVAGTMQWRLYLGYPIANPSERCVISMVDGSVKIPTEQLRRELGYSIKGVPPLSFVGSFDEPTPERRRAIAHRSVLVELMPPGDSARRSISAPLAPREAVLLGVSVGAIVERAARAGVLLTGIRPEYIWVDRDRRNRLIATAVTDRYARFFRSRTNGELSSFAAFPRCYGAYDGGSPSDRSLVFTLSALIAEWVTGHHPFPNVRQVLGCGIFTAVELADLRGVPTSLELLLARGLSLESERRPPLSSFLHELERLRL